MVIYLGKHGRPSMKEVFKKVGGKLIIKSDKLNGYVIRNNAENPKQRKIVKELTLIENEVVIRWGNYAHIEHTGCTVYNKAETLKLANQKGECRLFLQEKGIAVPKTCRWGGEGMNFPLVARPEHHGQGKMLFVCNNLEELQAAREAGCTYYSEVYPKTEEYRVHCGSGKILAVMKKPAPDDINQIAWNKAINDKPFEVLGWESYRNYICKLALEACEAVGLDFSGVDIMANPKDWKEKGLPRAVVCEINTAPTLNSSPYVLEKYVSYFKWLEAGGLERRKHWNWREFKKPSSLAWKKDQFGIQE